MAKRGSGKKRQAVKKNSASFGTSYKKPLTDTSKSNVQKESSKSDAISVSELNSNYQAYFPKKLIVISLIIVFLALVGCLFYFEVIRIPNIDMPDFSFFNFFSKQKEVSDNLSALNNATNGTVVSQEVQKLSCEERVAILVPDQIILMRQMGTGSEWMFNPLDNKLNSYANGESLVPERNLFYVRTRNSNYVAREGMTSNEYFKYNTQNFVFEFNPILKESQEEEDVLDVRGIPMITKAFLISDLHITKCLYVE